MDNRLGSLKKQMLLILIPDVVASIYLWRMEQLVTLLAINIVMSSVMFILYYIRKKIPTKINIGKSFPTFSKRLFTI